MAKKKSAHFTELEKSVLQTLCYFGVFKYPISFHKLCMYLDSSHDVKEVAATVQALVDTRRLSQIGDTYVLASLDPVDVNKTMQHSLAGIELAQFVCKYLTKVPWIKLVAVTGSTAAFNKTEDDDIDVFIVTQTQRLWLTRLCVFLILRVLGLYRTDAHSKDKICTNLFVDEASASWAEDANIYIAHEIVTMLPLINKNNAYLKFLHTNRWLCDYFPNFVFHVPLTTDQPIPKNVLMNAVEHFFAKLQLVYMRPKLTNERVAGGVAHFNKSDSKQTVLTKYEELVTSLGGK